VRVLITGGAGFIGSKLAERCLRRGDEVIVLDDLSTGRRDAVPPSALLIVADVADPAVTRTIREVGPNVIVHAAAQVSVERSVRDPDADASVNVAGTRNVANGAISGGATRFVFISSGGAVYGETTGATEESQVSPASPYGRHKLLAEETVATCGISYAIARLANVYGPGQRADQEGGVVAIFTDAIRSASKVTIHGDGEQRRDFVHVDDVASALVAMMATDRDGTWNVGTGTSRSILALLALLEERLGPAASIEHAPVRAGDIRDSMLSVDRIAADLGWRPTLDLEAGLDRLVGATS
jgi:UDP-glucose 4-epimerase